MSENYYTKLATLDVSEFVEKKGQFSYLSWAWAIDQLKRKHPDATWQVKKYENEKGIQQPYMETSAGYFVEVEVTVNGITHSQIHPVLDNKNKPVNQPDAFQINTAIQRCLVKGIAMHGLGLYIYAGEDLPIVQDEPIKQSQVDTIRAKVREFAGLRGRTDADVFNALKVPNIENITEAQGDQILDLLANWIKKAKDDVKEAAPSA